MSQILFIVLPIVAVILIGYGVGRTRLLTEEGVRALSNFCFYVAIPAMLFRGMAQLETAQGFSLTVVVAYFSAVLLAYAAAMAVARFAFGLTLIEQAMFAVGSSYGNILLLGLPLVLTAFGERAVLPQSLILAFNPLVLVTVTSIIVEMAKGRDGAAAGGPRESRLHGIAAIFTAAGIALATNPVIVAVVAGFAWGRTGLGLDPVVDRTLSFLGQAATPTALFGLGASLVRFKLTGDLRIAAAMSALKLLLLPVMVYISARFVFGLEPLHVAMATVSAAMPTGVTAFMLAMRYGVGGPRVAATLILTSLASVLAVSLLLAYFLPQIGRG